MPDDLPELIVPDVDAWRRWLDDHADDPRGVWLRLAKKGTVTPTSLSYAQALDEALCQGWIDGQVRKADDATYRQRFTPRRPRSLWSQRNVGHVARLTEQGRMRPRGLAEVARAQADGRWDAAYAGPATIQVPDDLAAALAADPAAGALFARLTGQNRYAVLYRVVTAPSPAARARRIAALVGGLAQGRTPYPLPAATAETPPAETPPAGPALVVGAAIVDDLTTPRTLLAARRTEPPRLAGGWELPGGKVEPGEDPLAALHREIAEELGVRVELGAEVPGPDPALPGWPLPPAHRMRVWLARVVDGEPAPIEDHDELRVLTAGHWFDVDWLPADVPIVHAVLGLTAPVEGAGRGT